MKLSLSRFFFLKLNFFLIFFGFIFIWEERGEADCPLSRKPDAGLDPRTLDPRTLGS